MSEVINDNPRIEIHLGDCIEVMKQLPDNSIDCCITSPPYWGLRDYQVSGQLGLEKTPEEYVSKMVEVFMEVKRVLKNEGTLWLNLGDSYASGQSNGNKKFGNEEFNKNRPSRERTLTPERKKPEGLKSKDIVGIPWMVAFALRADGWYLRQDIIWAKTSPMPESVTDRCTKAHEYIFLLAKSQKYYFDANAIKENSVGISGRRYRNPDSRVKSGDPLLANNMFKLIGKKFEKRNKRSVWTVNTKPFKGAHFATFPEDLILPCVLAGCPKGGTILDPFCGAATTGVVAKKNNRNFIGIELNPSYVEMSKRRINNTQGGNDEMFLS